MTNHETTLAIKALKVLAHVYIEHGRADKATELLQALDYLGYSSNQTLALLALAELLNGKPDSALQIIQRMVLAADEDHLQGAINLIHAQVLHKLEIYDDALELFNKYIEFRASSLISTQKQEV